MKICLSHPKDWGVLGSAVRSSVGFHHLFGQRLVWDTEQRKTAFGTRTPFSLFEFQSMLVGICNTPRTFQRLMFADQHCCSLLLYLVDVTMFSSTVDEHLGRLDLRPLQKEELKAKLHKCHFFNSFKTRGLLCGMPGSHIVNTALENSRQGWGLSPCLE